MAWSVFVGASLSAVVILLVTFFIDDGPKTPRPGNEGWLPVFIGTLVIAGGAAGAVMGAAVGVGLVLWRWLFLGLAAVPDSRDA